MALFALAFGLCGALTYYFISGEQDKTVYINNQQLFDEFLLKKELEKEYLSIEKRMTIELDSLKNMISGLNTELNKLNLEGKLSKDDPKVQQFNSLQEFAMNKEEEIKTRAQALITDYDAKIWKQLNQYVKDFSEKEGYDFVLGSKGDGNLMYAKDGNDVTKELIAYANNRYKGKHE